MCCKIPIESKAQRMPPSSKFPEGWRYYIDPSMPNFDRQKAKTAIRLGIEGLKLLPPTGIYSYYSVEAAKSYPNYRRVLADVSPEGFYQHIGALFSGPPRLETASQLSLPQESLSIHRVKGSRVYCSDNERWGIIEKKLQISNGFFRYSVRTNGSCTSYLSSFAYSCGRFFHLVRFGSRTTTHFSMASATGTFSLKSAMFVRLEAKLRHQQNSPVSNTISIQILVSLMERK